ncbi:MAG TPA: hypothetical protein PKK01_03825 [Mycobacterium sp.]|nr:hypothetical protein [Mycobacterium sp.]HPZ93358.1 hypothetical protein [Mycobacterium sp.]HQE13535.1 hypothetical protein [Mycobacterium sp.]
MIRFSVSALAVAAVMLAAPQAGADPEDLEPTCTSGQVPQAGACKPPSTGDTSGSAPGADPQIPLGLTPESVPAV